ncbi:MAG: ribosome silencing factor [Eubacteriales bacterium]|nr:ribosome silencing factor [Eubacteriales bacterium]MDD3073056.1 ribosome silencing factor [Eubacteriales bacterium]MDD4078105.1 ribosome silencing factor [Eubacteriales bacterium]MDD4768266.1 ribosome silencing factor [Eubacteriales bacterium]
MYMLKAVKLAGEAAEEKKAADIKILDISSRSSFTDYFILATGLNKIHTRAVADFVEETLAGQGILPFSKGGYQEGEWILLDYLDFVVHIFTPEARDYYQLERLWHQD